MFTENTSYAALELVPGWYCGEEEELYEMIPRWFIFPGSRRRMWNTGLGSPGGLEVWVLLDKDRRPGLHRW